MNDYLIIKGSALNLDCLPDDSIDQAITSPPYFGLRSYLENDDPLKRFEVGLEATPDEFVSAMVAVFRGVRRALKPTGTLWLNLGDSYVTKPMGGGSTHDPKYPNGRNRRGNVPSANRTNNPTDLGLKHKDLIGIPYRVAQALQADGWYWRSIVPWIKPNAMPSPIDDRPNCAHESIMIFSKNQSYYYDPDVIRKPSAPATIERDRYSRITTGKDGQYAVAHDHERISHELGRHRRSADWFFDSLDDAITFHERERDRLRAAREHGGLTVDADGDPLGLVVGVQPFKGAHYAVFPPRLVEPCIKAGTSERGCCPACGAPWVRVVERTAMVVRPGNKAGGYGSRTTDGLSGTMISPPTTTTKGWRASCGCSPHEPVPCTVLDPFGGAMTTIMVATQLGRRAIAFEINQESIDLGRKRLERPHASLAAPKAHVPDVIPENGLLFT